MSMNVKAKVNLHRFYNRKILLLVTLVFVIIVVASCIVFVFNGDRPLQQEVPDKIVSNEIELKNAVNTAARSITIALDKDIQLTEILVIHTGREITLTSNSVTGFYKLIGGANLSVISVEGGGVLRLDGIMVTHKNGEGRGVTVNEKGKLFLYSGEISGNHGAANSYDNGASDNGGGVYNNGTFTMSGGSITGNTAFYRGGGVYVGSMGTFTMSSGKIAKNTALYNLGNGDSYGSGGGVYVESGSFSMSGGSITGNKADWGGGVYVFYGSFSMSNGAISSNIAKWGGGMYMTYPISISRTGGTISDNTGGNVFNPNNNNETSKGDTSGDWKSFSLSRDRIIWIAVIVILVVVVGAVLLFTSKMKLFPIEEKLLDYNEKQEVDNMFMYCVSLGLYCES